VPEFTLPQLSDCGAADGSSTIVATYQNILIMLARISTLITALAVCLVLNTAAATDSPASVVNAFYKKHSELQLSGAPSPQQLKVVAPYLSQHLQALLERAWHQREQDLRASPDEKPAFAEGDLFTSLFEGPTSFQVLNTESLAHEYAVTVRFDRQSGKERSTWNDIVRVASMQGKLVIVDVEYGGKWDFAPKGTLVAVLEDGVLQR
jgi:hypothetical protein